MGELVALAPMSSMSSASASELSVASAAEGRIRLRLSFGGGLVEVCPAVSSRCRTRTVVGLSDAHLFTRP